MLKQATEQLFIQGTINAVATVGIENTRTKGIAQYAGFSEAMLFRIFPTKEILLRETFLSLDRLVSDMVIRSAFLRDPDSVPFELGVFGVWREIFRYLVSHKEETLFLIRYRSSSFYTDEIKALQPANNGEFASVYALLTKHYDSLDPEMSGFLANFIYEMTLCFAEKVLNGKIEPTEDAEQTIWMALHSAVKSLTQSQEMTA